MPQFKVKRKAFGPKRPGAEHQLLEVGALVERVDNEKCGDTYEPVEPEAKAADGETVQAARGRAARAKDAPVEPEAKD